MLNLAQTQVKVKQAPLDPTTMILNTQNLTAQSIAYAALTDRLGWSSDQANVEMHPTDRVPVFRLDRAALRRNKYGQGWIVEIDGVDTAIEGTLAGITERVKEMLAEAPQVEAEPVAAEPTPQVLSTITYSKLAKRYVVKNGSLVGTFPAGPEGRKAAELAALKHDGPDAYNAYLELVTQGEDEGRARRAARLVQRGHVDVEFGSVTSSDGSHIYSVNGTCECEDFQRHGGPCKHQLALQIAEGLDAELIQAAAVEREHLQQRYQRETALPASATGPQSMDDFLGYDPKPRNLGESIQQALGQPVGTIDTVPAQVSEADKQRALDKALGNQQPRKSYGQRQFEARHNWWG